MAVEADAFYKLGRMGKSGWSLPLVSTGTKPKPPTNRAVRTAMTKVIGRLLEKELRAPWNVVAPRWLWGGETALVTFQHDDELRQPATHLTCMFSRVDGWSPDLAEHWVDFVIAWRRDLVEETLRRLGVTIEAPSWPALRTVCKELRFFAYDGNVGYIDGDMVRWVLAPEDETPRPPSPAAEIESTLLKTATYCVCPTCLPVVSRVWPPLEVRDGVYVEPLHSALVVGRAVAPRGGGVIIASAHAGFLSWAGRIVDGVVHHVPELTHKSREPRWIHEVGDALVAILGATSAKPPWAYSESRDGGATWSAPVPSGLPPLRDAATYIQIYRPEIVFATPGTKRQLYLSTDGGRTFGPPLDPIFDGKSPHAIEDVNPFGRIYVALWHRTRESPLELATSSDGAEFTTLPSPVDEIAAIWPTTDGGLAVFGKYMHEAVVAVSHDEGATWTRSPAPSDAKDAYLGGRWFVVQRDVTPAILHASDDEGRTWKQVLSGSVEDVYADGADPMSCYVTVGGVLSRVVVGVTAPGTDTDPEVPSAS